MKKYLHYLIPFSLLIFLLVFYALFPGPVKKIKYRYFDVLQTLHPRPYIDAPVRIIDIDDESLEKFGQWPWPRTFYARLIDRLKEANVSVLAYDILLAETDRTSPSKLVNFWEQNGDLAPASFPGGNLPDYDDVLAKSMDTLPVVTAFSLHGEKTPRKPEVKAGFAVKGDDPAHYLADYPGAITTLPLFEEAAAGNGAINFFSHYGATIRRIPLIVQIEGQLYPTLSLEALRVWMNEKTYKIKVGGGGNNPFAEQKGIESIRVGHKTIPVDGQARMWLYDSGFVKKRSIPAWKVLEGKLAPGELKNMIVYLGTSAAGLKDLRSTPLNPVAAGVEVHAQLTEQVINGQFIFRPDWAPGAEFLFLVFLGLLLIVAMPRLGAAFCAAFTLLSFIGVYGFSWYVYVEHHWLFDPLLPSTACLLIYFTSSLIHFLRTDHEKRQIRGAFSRYLSPSVVEKLANRPDQLRLGGEMRSMSVLFADIRDFTTLSEQFQPHELTAFMNSFLTPMTEVILNKQGTIDKYMGDCIMAFWNAPLDDEKHAENACHSALEMQRKAEAFGGEKPIRLGIGINSGPCCVGNLGSDQRFDYSVMGDTVNIASRLEGLCKVYGVSIITGEETRKACPSLAFLEIDRVRVKGKKAAVSIYALLGGSDISNLTPFKNLQTRHQEMMNAYRKNEWEQAERLAKNCAEIRLPVNLKPLYKHYIEKINLLKANPPDENWMGVTDFDFK